MRVEVPVIARLTLLGATAATAPKTIPAAPKAPCSNKQMLPRYHASSAYLMKLSRIEKGVYGITKPISGQQPSCKELRRASMGSPNPYLGNNHHVSKL
jgi:hypothetical protein